MGIVPRGYRDAKKKKKEERRRRPERYDGDRLPFCKRKRLKGHNAPRTPREVLGGRRVITHTWSLAVVTDWPTGDKTCYPFHYYKNYLEIPSFFFFYPDNTIHAQKNSPVYCVCIYMYIGMSVFKRFCIFFFFRISLFLSPRVAFVVFYLLFYCLRLLLKPANFG